MLADYVLYMNDGTRPNWIGRKSSPDVVRAHMTLALLRGVFAIRNAGRGIRMEYYPVDGPSIILPKTGMEYRWKKWTWTELEVLAEDLCQRSVRGWDKMKNVERTGLARTIRRKFPKPDKAQENFRGVEGLLRRFQLLANNPQ